METRHGKKLLEQARSIIKNDILSAVNNIYFLTYGHYPDMSKGVVIKWSDISTTIPPTLDLVYDEINGHSLISPIFFRGNITEIIIGGRLGLGFRLANSADGGYEHWTEIGAEELIYIYNHIAYVESTKMVINAFEPKMVIFEK